MKLTDKQKEVIHYMVKYLKKDYKTQRYINIHNTAMNIDHTIAWFQHIWTGKLYQSLDDTDSKKRLNLVREYYLDRLKKDMK